MADRSHSEEAYVVGLLEDVLGAPALRGHRFDWLRGDPTARGRGVPLPVDAYWPAYNLVVEVYERQHDEPVPHFDKVERVTVSGVHRGEQRRIYDQRRRDLLPAHGLTLLIVRTNDLASDRRGRLVRDATADRPVLAELVRAALERAAAGSGNEAPTVEVPAWQDLLHEAPPDPNFADVGPFYDALGARRHLGGVSGASLRAMVATGDVLELQTGGGERVYPAWQFSGRSVRPELLSVFHALLGLDGWVAAAWLTSPHPDLEGRSPREALREGIDARLVASIAHRDRA